MRYRAFTTVLTAAALVYAPTPSFAQSAPQPAVSQEDGLALSHEPGHKRKKRLIWYILGGIAVAVAVYLLFIDDDDDPVSP
jgi:hypothetical protein